MGVFLGAWQEAWFPSNHATWISGRTDKDSQKEEWGVIVYCNRAWLCDDERILEMESSGCCRIL